MQMETRRRIVEAAVDLHGTLGPAHTSVVQIAERAGVQRHTFYAHFPEERELFLACSSLATQRDPLPTLEDAANLPPGSDRIRSGLEQFYGWYDRNAQLVSCVLRDAEYHALTREMVELRIEPAFDQARRVLGEGLGDRSSALLGVALDFSSWRRLSRTHGVRTAAALMADAIGTISGKAPI
jgi:AcrR family transcriptional regulator